MDAWTWSRLAANSGKGGGSCKGDVKVSPSRHQRSRRRCDCGAALSEPPFALRVLPAWRTRLFAMHVCALLAERPRTVGKLSWSSARSEPRSDRQH